MQFCQRLTFEHGAVQSQIIEQFALEVFVRQHICNNFGRADQGACPSELQKIVFEKKLFVEILLDVDLDDCAGGRAMLAQEVSGPLFFLC